VFGLVPLLDAIKQGEYRLPVLLALTRQVSAKSAMARWSSVLEARTTLAAHSSRLERSWRETACSMLRAPAQGGLPISVELLLHLLLRSAANEVRSGFSMAAWMACALTAGARK